MYKALTGREESEIGGENMKTKESEKRMETVKRIA